MNGIDPFLYNPIVTGVSIILTIISIVVATVYYIKSKALALKLHEQTTSSLKEKEKILCYFVSSDVLIAREKLEPVDGIKIEYKEKVLTGSLKVSEILFWNGGEIAIDYKNDIISTLPVSISFYNTTNNAVFNCDDILLDAKIEKSSVAADASIIKHDNYIQVNFDYLDCSDEIKIRLVHYSDKCKIAVKGTVKGGKLSRCNFATPHVGLKRRKTSSRREGLRVKRIRPYRLLEDDD